MKQQLSTGGTTKWQLQKAHPNWMGFCIFSKVPRTISPTSSIG
ncbi:hypothetical protein [Flagellimonas olearia]|nr:hypothetical protein [Allomuricauda olearia]